MDAMRGPRLASSKIKFPQFQSVTPFEAARSESSIASEATNPPSLDRISTSRSIVFYGWLYLSARRTVGWTAGSLSALQRLEAHTIHRGTLTIPDSHECPIIPFYGNIVSR